MNNIYIIGFMGSGKSTIGKSLAQSLNKPFLDLDTFIEQKENTSIHELFELKGEKAFRETESYYLRQLDKLSGYIISLGGGTPCVGENHQYIQFQNTIFLEVLSEELTRRLWKVKHKRPLISKIDSKVELGIFVNNLLALRQSHYQKAKFHIMNNSDVETVISRIEKQLNKV